ncbi:MAG: PRC-barrel domain-containing protein [Geminicoccaceae bacterium]
MAQDEAAPSDTEQQMEQGLQEEAAPEGATEQAPAMTEEQPAEEQAPATTAEQPAPEGATGQAPAMTEEQPAEEQAPTMAEEPPADEAEEMAAEEVAPPADMEFLQVQEEAQFLANDEVIGRDVVNEMDEQVGSIADLVMDQDQKLVGVVLSVGGFLGVGDKWVAVPVEQIDFPTAEEPARLLAPVTEEQLTNAPDFMTRKALEAEQAATQAQGQATQGQAPAPTVPAQ